jgi:hypothetical protein
MNMDSPTTGETQARRLEAVSQQISMLVRQPENAERLRAAPGQSEWNVLQNLGHIAEMIPYWLDQSRRMILADSANPHTVGRTLDDPERLTGVERGAAGDPDELLAQVQEQARKGAAAIRAFTPEERAKKGVHPRLGELSVEDMIERFIIVHAEDHLKQMRETLGQ